MDDVAGDIAGDFVQWFVGWCSSAAPQGLY
jgi:hypothetical protein